MAGARPGKRIATGLIIFFVLLILAGVGVGIAYAIQPLEGVYAPKDVTMDGKSDVNVLVIYKDAEGKWRMGTDMIVAGMATKDGVKLAMESAKTMGTYPIVDKKDLSKGWRSVTVPAESGGKVTWKLISSYT